MPTQLRRAPVAVSAARPWAAMGETLHRIGLSWWRDGLGGGEVTAPVRQRQRAAAEEVADARVAGITAHFSRLVTADTSSAGRRGPMPASRRAAEYQWRGPDLTRMLPPDLKARRGRWGAVGTRVPRAALARKRAGMLWGCEMQCIRVLAEAHRVPTPCLTRRRASFAARRGW